MDHLDRYSVCDCPLDDHPSNLDNVPNRDILLDYGSCARRCVFCNAKHSRAPNLRDHQCAFSHNVVILKRSGRNKRRKGHTWSHLGKSSPTQLAESYHTTSGNKQSSPLSPSPPHNGPPTTPGTSTPTPHPLLPLDISPHWSQVCPAQFQHGLRTLREAQADKGICELWRGKLPEVDTESAGNHIEVAANIIQFLFKPKIIRDADVIRGTTLPESTAEKTLYAATAIYQMNLPTVCDADEICRVLNICVPTVPTIQPKERSTVYVKVPETGLSINVGPKGTFVDGHIDSGNIGRAVVFGNCIKVWLCFPPTTHNMRLWAAHLGTNPAFAIYGSRLQGGIIIRTSNDPSDDGNCITLPAGTLHAVFTVSGGFLGGINYATHGCLAVMTQCIVLQLPRTKDDGIDADITWFSDTLRQLIEFQPPEEESIHSALYNIVPILQVMEDHPLNRGFRAFQTMDIAIDAILQELKVRREDRNGVCKCDCGLDVIATRDGLMKHY